MDKNRKIGYLTKEIFLRGLQIIIFSPLFEIPPLRQLRHALVRLLFNAGKKVQIGMGVYFVVPHFPNQASIKIGKNVMIHRNVEIDYSGGIVIEDDVWISQNVLIETHEHVISERPKKEWDIKFSPLVIEQDAWVAANVTVLPRVKKIGRGAVIGAGSVVTKDVEPMTIIAGVPGRVIALRGEGALVDDRRVIQ